MRAILAVVVGAVALLAGATAARGDNGTTVTVMTRNLYFGADLAPVIGAPTTTEFLLGVAGAYNQGVARGDPRLSSAETHGFFKHMGER